MIDCFFGTNLKWRKKVENDKNMAKNGQNWQKLSNFTYNNCLKNSSKNLVIKFGVCSCFGRNWKWECFSRYFYVTKIDIFLDIATDFEQFCKCYFCYFFEAIKLKFWQFHSVKKWRENSSFLQKLSKAYQKQIVLVIVKLFFWSNSFWGWGEVARELLVILLWKLVNWKSAFFRPLPG